MQSFKITTRPPTRTRVQSRYDRSVPGKDEWQIDKDKTKHQKKTPHRTNQAPNFLGSSLSK